MRARVPRSRVTHERWLISYADFITLLFAFFVVLYAFAKTDQKKQVQVVNSIDTAFHSLGLFADISAQAAKPSSNPGGTDQAVMPMNVVMGEDVLSPTRVKDDLGRIKKDLDQRLSDKVAQHTVAIKMGRDGLVISLKETGFFDSGSATPRPEAAATLRKICVALAQTPYSLRVEGHTDNIPMHSVEFDSNWELSSSRATHIARMILYFHGIPADRLSAAGYAEYHPVDSNATAEGRANNRRVDLVVMPRSATNLALPLASPPDGPWHKITDSD